MAQRYSQAFRCVGKMIKDILTSIVTAIVGTATEEAIKQRKQKRKMQKENSKAYQGDFQKRPELEIVDYKNYIKRPSYGVKQKCDAEFLVVRIESVTVDKIAGREIVNAHYYAEDSDSTNWCCVIYTFKNAGKTDISTVDIFCNYKRRNCIFSRAQATSWMRDNFLNYSFCYDKKVRAGDAFTVKICYHKDRVDSSAISAVLSIGMRDDNGRYWRQPLFAPDEKVYDSCLISSKEYYDEILTEKAEECFKNPVLW